MKKILNFLKSDLGRIILGATLFAFAIITEIYFKTFALILYVAALLISGFPVFFDAVRGILRRDLLDEKFLMSIASIGAMFVGEWHEGVAVMLFFLVGEYFEHKAVAKSRKSIRALMDIRPDEAVVLFDGREEIRDAEDVTVGSTILIKAGERVPIDSVVISGSADIDTSAITGEALPVSATVGTELSSGSVILNGVLCARTLREVDESCAARILDLVENANERKSKTENFITKFSHFYTPIVVSLAVLLALLPPLFDLTGWAESIYRALIFLVISCPCALVISVPMAFFGGIGGAASKGILYKGGNTFSALAKADSFAFDKTGTLTTGEFSVSNIYPYNIDQDEFVRLVASAEYGSNHPIAKAVQRLSEEAVLPDSVTEKAGLGVVAKISGDEIILGNLRLLEEYGVKMPSDCIKQRGIYAARNSEYIGSIIISDKVKPEACESITKLKELGAKRTLMLSGDRRENAENVGKLVGIDEIYSELLPQDKYEKLQEIINTSTKTVYVGDGINDAPAIALADVGVAMGAVGSDSAIESADVVIMSDNLSRLPTAVKIARRTVRIAKENIVFALGVKGAILVLGALGIANMWLAVFADVGVAALAILNSMRTLR